MKNVYEECPVFENEHWLLRFVEKSDSEALLKVYGDKNALPFFNSDNCDGDNFYYHTKELMDKAMDFWLYSYREKWFVRWAIIDKASGKAIQTKSGKVTAGTVLVQNTKNGSSAQQFWMVRESKQVKVNFVKTYYIGNRGASGFALKVANNSNAAMTNICLGKNQKDYNLKFQLIYSGDGYYRIMNTKTKKFLTIAGNSTANGANVIQDTWKNQSGQRWLPKQNKDGSYTLVSKLGICLQIAAGTAKPGSGTNVNAGKNSNAATQHWTLNAA